MIDARYRRAAGALVYAAASLADDRNSYARGVLDAASFLTGLTYTDEFQPVYDRYTDLLVTSIMNAPPQHEVPR